MSIMRMNEEKTYSIWWWLAVLVLSVPAAIYCAWLFTFAWGWFVADVFHVGRLRVIDAMGLQLVIGWAQSGLARRSDTKKDEQHPLTTLLVYPVIATLCFAFAALYHSFQ